jgi:hypothetical protein
MQESIALETKEYFNKEEGYSVIRNDITQWLNLVSSKIEPLTYDICDKYQIPRTIFSLSMKSDKPEINMIKLDLSDVAGMTVASIFGLLLATIILVISIPFFGGVLGWIYGLFLATISLGASVVGIQNFANNVAIPLNLREMLLSESDMDRAIENKRPEIEIGIKEELKKNLQSEDKLREIFSYIKKGLYKRADEAAIVIKTSEKASLSSY